MWLPSVSDTAERFLETETRLLDLEAELSRGF
jgi:hypothetical protein